MYYLVVSMEKIPSDFLKRGEREEGEEEREMGRERGNLTPKIIWVNCLAPNWPSTWALWSIVVGLLFPF